MLIIGSALTVRIRNSVVNRRRPFGLFSLSCSCFLLSLILNGCTFYALDGNGPRTHQQIASGLEDIDTETLKEYRELALGVKPYELGKGYTLRMYAPGSNAWTFLAGPLSIFSLRTPPPSEASLKRELLLVEKGYASFPLGSSKISYDAFDSKSGQCLYRSYQWGLAALIVYDRTLAPQGIKPMGRGSSSSIDIFDLNSPESLMYNKQSGLCLGLGLLAYGEKNGKRYLQIAWIPIPIGNTKD